MLYLFTVLVPAIVAGTVLFILLLKNSPCGLSLTSVLSVWLPVGIALIASAISFIIAGVNMHRHYNRLNRINERLLAGRYDKITYGGLNKDEAYLIASVNDLSSKFLELDKQLNQLSERRNMLENERGSLQFSLLTAKSSPLLLSRSLSVLRQQAECGDIEKLTETTDDLICIMRSALVDGQSLVPLTNELELIKRYVDVNAAVQDCHIDYRMSVMCNIVNYKIIPHIIFPIIESFFEFALRGSTTHYEIGVEVTSSVNHLLIIIRDNGVGINPSTLEQIQHELEGDVVDLHRNVISLPNINRRIKLFYGDRYGVKLSSSALGTIVRIYLPAKGDDF